MILLEVLRVNFMGVEGRAYMFEGVVILYKGKG